MAASTGSRRRADRREQILDATLRVIARDGLDGIRSALVAREAGVSPALPHYYYPTLDDLVVAAYLQDEERTWRGIPVDADPLDVLHGALSSFFAAGESELRTPMMLWHEYARRAVFDERVHDVVAPRIGRWGEAIAGAVDRLRADGRIPSHVDTRLATLLLLAGWAGDSALVLLGHLSSRASEADQRRRVDGLAAWPRPSRYVWQAPALRIDGIEADEGDGDRPDAILDATLRVISREGVRGVHFPEVAAEAAVSPSLPRYYFPTVEGLLGAAFARDAMLARRRVLARAAELADPLDRLRDACTWETAGDPGDMHDGWIVLSELLRRGFVEGELRVRAQERLRAWEAHLTVPILELERAGRATPEGGAATAARSILAVQLGLGLGLLFGVATAEEFAWAADASVSLELGLGELPVRP